jgi:LAGLIDADG DNA endonuclease family protein
MDTEQIKERLLQKNDRASSPIPSKNLLSTGSTLINLGCSGRTNGAIAKGTYVFFVGDSESGKAQPVTAKVLTPSGWQKMGDLEVGDTIIDPDGGTGLISAVYPQGRKTVFRVTFSDGASTECCADHLWMTFTQNQKKTGTYRVQRLLDVKREVDQGIAKYIPLMEPADLIGGVNLPINPYVLGVLIGNGHFGKGGIQLSTKEVQILEEVKNKLLGCRLSHRGKGDWCIVNRKSHKNPMVEAISSLGLIGCKSIEKFIPKEYLRSSILTRLALLQGLMDTDGYAAKNGAIEYSTSSPQLAGDAVDLIRSLGGRASKRCCPRPKYTYNGEQRIGQPSYTLAIKLPLRFSPFRLMRKLTRYKSKGIGLNRRIVRIERVGVAECRCISVTTKRGLYVTDDYIITHNTFFVLTCFAEACRNKHFQEYRLIYDNPEDGALMNWSQYFGPKAAERIEPPAASPDGEPIYSETVEDFYYNIDDASIAGKPFIYVLDSMDALTSKADDAKFKKQKAASRRNTTEAGSYGMAKPKLNSEYMRLALRKIKKNGSILIIISQTRDNPNAFGYGDKKTRAGGRALKFYATLEIWTSVRETLRKVVNGKPRAYGIIAQADIKKNRLQGKKRRVFIPILNDYGIDDVGSCVDFLVDEGHWKEKGKKIQASEFTEDWISKENLIQHIETEEQERELRKIVETVWNGIEDGLKTNRKRRYE